MKPNPAGARIETKVRFSYDFLDKMLSNEYQDVSAQEIQCSFLRGWPDASFAYAATSCSFNAAETGMLSDTDDIAKLSFANGFMASRFV